MPPAKTRKRTGGRRATESITSAQRKTFYAVQDFIGQYGYPPTLKELSKLLNLGMTPVNDSLRQLIRKGYLSRKPNTPRSLSIVRQPEEEQVTGFVSLKLYGVVAAGQPVLTEENEIGEALVPASMVQRGEYFALKVRGESMVGADIHDGDTVIVRKQQLAQTGDIVVAAIDGETTIKRLSLTQEAIELRPENGKRRPIRVDPDSDFRVYGKVVAHSRQWSS